MEKLNCEDLCEYLKHQGLEQNLADRLKDEEVDGRQFLKITPDVLRACAFKVGQITKILEIQSKPFKELFNNDENKRKGESEAETETDNSDSDNLRSDLGQYFDAKQLKDLSHYELKSYFHQLDRYNTAKDMGANADMCKPFFVKDFEAKAKKAQSRSTPSTQPTRSLRSTSQASQSTEAGPSTSRASQSTEARPSTSWASQSTEAGPSTSRVSHSIEAGPSTSQASKESTLEATLTDSEPSSSQNDLRVDLTSPLYTTTESAIDLPPNLLKVQAQDSHLPKYNIYQIFNTIFETGKDQIKTAFIKLKEGIPLKRIDRKRVMRVLAIHLYRHIASSPKDVTPDMKEGLAKSFVLAFPAYLVTSNDGRKPWALIFNRNGTGFLANASRSLQSANPRRPKKKRAAAISCADEGSTSEYNSDFVKELALAMPDRTNRKEILDGMANTYKMRKVELKRGVTVAYLVNKYPHLGSYDGEVLREEFKRIHPQAKDGLKELARVLPNILKLTEKRFVSMECDDDVLKGLLRISQNLPHDTRGGHRSTWAKLEDLVNVLKTGDDVETHCVQRAAEGTIQPYLIFIRAAIGKKIVRSFLVLDRKPIQVAGNSLKAFDALFKSFFVFNVHYPAGWHSTFHFLATCFYNVFEVSRKRPDCITPNEDELFKLIGGKF